MFTSVKALLNSYKYEKDSTITIFNSITNDALSTTGYEGGRTLGFLMWHIVTTTSEMAVRAGIELRNREKDPMPETVAEMVAAYSEDAEKILEFISNLSDADLLIKKEYYGEQWRLGKAFFTVIIHQTHHRGQMTILMRKADLRVHGVYGPGKEQWAEIGMPEMP